MVWDGSARNQKIPHIGWKRREAQLSLENFGRNYLGDIYDVKLTLHLPLLPRSPCMKSIVVKH